MTNIDTELECLDDDGLIGACRGPVEIRMALSATGMPFARCDKHWGERLDRQEKIDRRYPVLQPRDFDPGYAGESWDEDL